MHESTHHAGHSQSMPEAQGLRGTHRDPVCGMTVSEATPHRSRYRDVDYFFCSAGCKLKFEREPEKFAPASGGEPESAARPASGSGVPAAAKWTCPMHPEIVRDAAGSCPICGMALERENGVARAPGESRAPRHEPAFLVRRGACRPAHALVDGRHATGEPRQLAAVATGAGVARTRAGDAGLPLVCLAVLRAGRSVTAEPKPEHVHADRARRERRLRLQRGCGAGASGIPGFVSRSSRWGRRRISKPRP